MSHIRNRADVVIVGLGWAGSVMAEELTRAGLNVVAIERGAWRDTSTDFPRPLTRMNYAGNLAVKLCSP
ncbi:hypothetical protein ERHA54_08510 [Erwinia rhapontici]|nr:hypothetical protein ERHA54_08510 [Erwinia rhapontici]